MCAIMVVLQLMLPRDSLSNMVSLLSLQSIKITLVLLAKGIVAYKKHCCKVHDDSLCILYLKPV